MATSQRRPWLRPAFLCVLILIVAGIAAVPLVQHLVEQRIQQSFASTSRMDSSIDGVDYSLLSNELILNGIKAKTISSPNPMSLSCDKLTIRGVDRTFIFDLLLRRIGDTMPPMLHITNLDVQRMSITFGKQDLVFSIGQRTIDNLSINLEKIASLRAMITDRKAGNASDSFNDLAVLQKIITCVSYEKGYAKDIQVSLADPFLPSITVQELVESQISGTSIAYSELRGTVITENLTGSAGKKELARIDRLAIEDFFCPADILDKDPDFMTEEEALAYIKQIFLGEKPFIRKFVIDNFQSDITAGLNFGLQNLTWENTSTSPFDCSLSIRGLSMPAAISPTIAMLGYKQINVNSTIALTLPTKTAGPASCEVLIEGKDAGTLALQCQYTVHDPKALYSGDPSVISISRSALSLKDDGLLKRLEQFSSIFSGQQSLADSLDELVNTMPETYRTPANLKNIESLKTFLRQSGSIEFVFAPKQPVSLDQLEDDSVFFDAVTSTVSPASPSQSGSNAVK